MAFQYMLLHMLLQLVLQHGMPINTVTCDWYRIGTGSDLTNCRTDVESVQWSRRFLARRFHLLDDVIILV